MGQPTEHEQIDEEFETIILAYYGLAEKYSKFAFDICIEIEQYVLLWQEGWLYPDKRKERENSEWNQFPVDIRYGLQSVYGRVGEIAAKIAHWNTGKYVLDMPDATTKETQADKSIDFYLMMSHWTNPFAVQVKRVSHRKAGMFRMYTADWTKGDTNRRMVLVDLERRLVYGCDMLAFKGRAPSDGHYESFETLKKKIGRDSYILRF